MALHGYCGKVECDGCIRCEKKAWDEQEICCLDCGESIAYDEDWFEDVDGYYCEDCAECAEAEEATS